MPENYLAYVFVVPFIWKCVFRLIIIGDCSFWKKCVQMKTLESRNLSGLLKKYRWQVKKH
jgi:hypothetical protein